MIKGVTGIHDVGGKIAPVALNDSIEIKKGNISEIKSSTNLNQSNSATEFDLNNSNINKKKDSEDRNLTEENVDEMSDALNDLMKKMNYDIEFSYYKDLDRLVMKVVDRKTQETIKQMPPEEMLDTLTNLREWIGVFLDKKA